MQFLVLGFIRAYRGCVLGHREFIDFARLKRARSYCFPKVSRDRSNGCQPDIREIQLVRICIVLFSYAVISLAALMAFRLVHQRHMWGVEESSSAWSLPFRIWHTSGHQFGDH